MDFPQSRFQGSFITCGSSSKGTAQSIVSKLTDALAQALNDPAVEKRFLELGSSAPAVGERGSAGLQKLVESEIARLTPIIKAAGVTAE